MRCRAGAKVPAVFNSSTQSLSKSFDLFRYNFGNARIEGNIYYVGDKLQFDSYSQLELRRPGAFKFEDAVEKLEELTTSVGKMEADNQAVCDLLDEHADALGLGEVRDTLRIKQSIVIMDLLDGTLKDAAENYKQVRK
ncbi:MAG TPA: hypothetical protein H9896_06830 [Candidatus Pygmaiobacter gallistercoris]|nr:hypothetical protein [Candidatus Pygmaiobacter gallistercoris]